MWKSTILGKIKKETLLKRNKDGEPRLVMIVSVGTGCGDKRKYETIRCIIFGKRSLATFTQKLRKGREVYIDGYTSTNEYIDFTGGKQIGLNVNIIDVNLVGEEKGEVHKVGNRAFPNMDIPADLTCPEGKKLPF